MMVTTLNLPRFCIYCGVGPRLGGSIPGSVSHTCSTTVVLVVVVLTRENPYRITLCHLIVPGWPRTIATGQAIEFPFEPKYRVLDDPGTNSAYQGRYRSPR